MCLVTKYILLQKLITKAWKETNHSNAAKNVTNVTEFIIQQFFYSKIIVIKRNKIQSTVYLEQY